MVGDLDTPEDRELFLMELDAGTWTEVALTLDAVEDSNPRVALDGLGNVLLAWYRGGDLVGSVEPFTGAPATFVEGGGAARRAWRTSGLPPNAI